MGIKTWDGAAYKDIVDLGVPGAPATAAFVWDGAAYVKVWPEGRLFQDDFNRPDQRLGASPNWVDYTHFGPDDAVIVNHTLQRTGTGAGGFDLSDASIWQTATNGVDQFAKLTIVDSGTAGNGPGVILGAAADNSALAIHAAMRSDGWILAVSNLGFGNFGRTIATGAEPTNNGSVIQLQREGNNLRLYIDGVKVADVTDNNLPTGKYVGVRPGNGWAVSDDWLGGDLNQAPPL